MLLAPSGCLSIRLCNAYSWVQFATAARTKPEFCPLCHSQGLELHMVAEQLASSLTRLYARLLLTNTATATSTTPPINKTGGPAAATSGGGLTKSVTTELAAAAVCGAVCICTCASTAPCPAARRCIS